MAKHEDLLVPVAFVKRWLEESEDQADFQRRFDHYVEKNTTNWNIPKESE